MSAPISAQSDVHRHLRLARPVLVLVGLVVGLAGVIAGPAGAANSNSDLNHPSYYEAQGFGTCTKTEPVSTPYTLPAPPSGTTWTLLVLKAGSAASNDDWNTLISTPVPGTFTHPSGKSISHVITCRKPTGSGTTTTTTSTTTTAPGGPCGTYTPTQVAVQPPTVQIGGQITVTGVASPGATVTATLTGNSTTLVMGPVTAGPTGQFSITATLPSTVRPGTYTIAVTSNLCPTPVNVTLTVVGLSFSGCGSNNDERTFNPGETVSWDLHEPSFDTSKPVKLRLEKTGYAATLYSGPWPSTNKVTVVIPTGATAAKYTMVQEATKPNGKLQTKTCPVWVELGSSTIAATAGRTGDESSPADAVLLVVVVGLTGLAMVQLRRRAPRHRT